MAYRWVILVFGMLAYMASFFARTSYTGIAKFIATDLGLDKSQLGLMGSVFFYAYALSQMPWGLASDKWGSRKAVTLSMFATALTIWGFSTSASFRALEIWRVLNGIAAAGVYVAMSGAISRWFMPKERAFSNALFAAVGGTVGEGTSSVILPYLVTRHFGWRSSTAILGGVIAVIGLMCGVALKSEPPGHQAVERKPFDWSIARNLDLWSFTAIYSGSIIAIRVLVPWLAIYATDIYVSRGMPVVQAALTGGILSSFYLGGRLLGVPAAGFVSDRLLARGVTRKSIAVAFLFVTMVLLWMMPMGIASTPLLGMLAFLLGVSINMYPLITTAVSESFGAQQTSSAMGLLNTVAQFSGAMALSVSGYFGIALSAKAGTPIDEYRGIWLVGIAGCIATVVLGLGIGYVARMRKPAAI